MLFLCWTSVLPLGQVIFVNMVVLNIHYHKLSSSSKRSKTKLVFIAMKIGISIVMRSQTLATLSKLKYIKNIPVAFHVSRSIIWLMCLVCVHFSLNREKSCLRLWNVVGSSHTSLWVKKPSSHLKLRQTFLSLRFFSVTLDNQTKAWLSCICGLIFVFNLERILYNNNAVVL